MLMSGVRGVELKNRKHLFPAELSLDFTLKQGGKFGGCSFANYNESMWYSKEKDIILKIAIFSFVSHVFTYCLYE